MRTVIILEEQGRCLSDADRILIIGHSFPSIDHRFRTLMRRINRRNDKKYKAAMLTPKGERKEPSAGERSGS